MIELENEEEGTIKRPKMEEDEISKLCRCGLLPKIPFLIEDRDDAFLRRFFKSPSSEYSKDQAYASTGEKCELPLSIAERGKILSVLNNRIKSEDGKDWWRNLKRKSRSYILLFLSESFDGRKAWSSSENSKLVEGISGELYRTCAEDGSRKKSPNGLSAWFTENMQECTTPSESDFHCILQLLKGRLTKSEWKHFPATAHGFGWLLKQITYPFLGFETDLVIPPSLLFTDDYFDDHKILGLECLSHIVQNVDKVDLTRSNWTNVVYDAVKRLVTDKDPIVINLAMPILLKMLQIMEKDPAQQSAEFTQYDNLIKDIIFQMEVGSDLAMKRTWFPLLDDLLKVCGTATLHWSDKLCEMLRDSTVCNDAFIWKYILQVTGTIIRNTWFKVDCESIAEIIFRVLLNLSSVHAKSIKEIERKEVVQHAHVCLTLLRSCDGFDEIDAQITKIVENNDNLLNPDFVTTVKNIKLALV